MNYWCRALNTVSEWKMSPQSLNEDVIIITKGENSTGVTLTCSYHLGNMAMMEVAAAGRKHGCVYKAPGLGRWWESEVRKCRVGSCLHLKLWYFVHHSSSAVIFILKRKC